MGLKEATMAHHSEAETAAFVEELMGGISEERYATYLYNQHPMYDVLEAHVMAHGLFNTIPEIRRAPSIFEDYKELHNSDAPLKRLPVVDEYIDYIKTIGEDKDKLMAHVYVRHMGDLFGGQMIAKCVPGAGKYYQFDGDIDELKGKLRKLLNDDMAEEAKLAFTFATKLFKQMDEA